MFAAGSAGAEGVGRRGAVATGSGEAGAAVTGADGETSGGLKAAGAEGKVRLPTGGGPNPPEVT